MKSSFLLAALLAFVLTGCGEQQEAEAPQAMEQMSKELEAVTEAVDASTEAAQEATEKMAEEVEATAETMTEEAPAADAPPVPELEEAIREAVEAATAE